LATANFEIELEYNVDGPSGHLFGDGFANGFDGLGIFFDTYDNERSHVSLKAML
jgi:mannose-binding lectin 2